jgi:nitroimidazol reductase NimA-like FMN-containing flavoprotein (pyridoxamine 5'-phosphate oxidase superfamily)
MSDLSRIRTHADRAVPDRAAEFLAAGLVAHVGIVQDGQPIVIPMIYGYDPAEPDRLYLHGSQASRLQNFLAGGAPVCVEVTTVDGLVYSRSALYHSANYRSVVCFGTAHAIADNATKDAVFEKMIGRYFPGRTAGKDYLPSSPAELDATSMVEIRIREMSAKMRVGPPKGPNDDQPGALGSCGVEEFVIARRKVPAGE